MIKSIITDEVMVFFPPCFVNLNSLSESIQRWCSSEGVWHTPAQNPVTHRVIYNLLIEEQAEEAVRDGLVQIFFPNSLKVGPPSW